ncbi:MAG TPA: ROK family protein [Candidatus Cybelea sp.]|nr:ROK family protein [Candidatus Cybelea sp.]
MRVGVDLGGTKIEVAALAGDGSEMVRRRIATPAGDYEATVRAVASLVEAVEAETGERGSVGIGTPGAIVPATGLLRNSNSVVLNGKPLKRDLEARLGREVKIANDANCFALSEAVDGAGAGSRVVFGVIVGTGVGGGIVVDGRPIPGLNNVAGEWGHNPLPWARGDELPGPPCYCGKRGCIETFLSGPGFAARSAQSSGRELTAVEIVTAAQRGDVEALRDLSIYEDRLARALAHVVNILDPDVIVVGGGLSNVATLYDNVPPAIERYAISAPIEVRLVAALHGDSSGVRGAAWL